MTTYQTVILSEDEAKIALESIRRHRLEAKELLVKLDKVEESLVKQVYPV